MALLAEEMAGQRGVQIVRRYDPSLPPILADEDRILQVFHNLVRNAVEAMPRGGRLTAGCQSRPGLRDAAPDPYRRVGGDCSVRPRWH